MRDRKTIHPRIGRELIHETFRYVAQRREGRCGGGSEDEKQKLI